jgi:malonyl CoA-acyl carrier protein transacylase
MSILPDTAALRSRARRLDADAEDLEQRIRSLRAAIACVVWVSLAADRFKAVAAGMCADLDAAAARLRQAAAELRAHADSVDRIVQTALVLPGAILSAGEHVASDVAKRALSVAGL